MYTYIYFFFSEKALKHIWYDQINWNNYNFFKWIAIKAEKQLQKQDHISDGDVYSKDL